MEDPLDVAACVAAHRAMRAMNLWYGDLALLIRNFATSRSYAVHLVATTERVGPVEASGLDRTRAALDALARSDEPRALADALMRASAHPTPHAPMKLDACSVDDAFARLVDHFARSHLGAPADEARTLLDFFAWSGHAFFDCGDLRRGQIETTAIFVRAASGERVALLEYLGDGR
jgi:hypothetical protein